MALNPHGRTYLEQIRPILQALFAASQSMDHLNEGQVLRLVSDATFHTYWLAPALSDFSDHYPETKIELLTPAQLGDRIADVSIQVSYAARVLPGAARIFDLVMLPACSTRLPGIEAITSAGHLRRHTLIDSPQSLAPWRLWLGQTNLKPSEMHWLMVDSHQSALEMLRRRLGICLTANFLVQRLSEDIATPVPITCRTPGGMDMILSPGNSRKIARDFRDWVVAEAERCQKLLIN